MGEAEQLNSVKFHKVSMSVIVVSPMYTASFKCYSNKKFKCLFVFPFYCPP